MRHSHRHPLRNISHPLRDPVGVIYSFLSPRDKCNLALSCKVFYEYLYSAETRKKERSDFVHLILERKLRKLRNRMDNVQIASDRAVERNEGLKNCCFLPSWVSWDSSMHNCGDFVFCDLRGFLGGLGGVVRVR